MRKIKKYAVFLIAISLVTFSSCSKNDDEDSATNGDEFLTAKIDGANYAAAQNPAVIVGAQSTNGVLAVQGGDNNGNTITIALPNYTGVGTYKTGDNITNQNVIMYLEISGTRPTSWASNFATLTPGTIEITTDDGTTVEGTFSFDGSDASTTKKITEGKFKAKFD